VVADRLPLYTTDDQQASKASPPPEPPTIPLRQHRTPRHYRAKNHELWPALTATHLRDHSGRVVHIVEFVVEEIGIVVEAAAQVIQEVRGNFEEKVTRLECLIASQTEAIDALKRVVAAAQSDADGRDSKLRAEVDIELASLRAALEERIDQVAATLEPIKKHGNRRSAHGPAETIPPS
jgi:uncharacterized coiled-coil protein SlyX